MPADAIMSRRSSLAASETVASSASRESSVVSLAAVLARIVATPSSRLSWSAFLDSVSSVSALIRARSSRTRSATTWNLVRADGETGPRWERASTSLTARARTGMMPSLSPCRRPLRWLAWVRVFPDWRWPRLAKVSLSTAAGPLRPRHC